MEKFFKNNYQRKFKLYMKSWHFLEKEIQNHKINLNDSSRWQTKGPMRAKTHIWYIKLLHYGMKLELVFNHLPSRRLWIYLNQPPMPVQKHPTVHPLPFNLTQALSQLNSDTHDITSHHDSLVERLCQRSTFNLCS